MNRIDVENIDDQLIQLPQWVCHTNNKIPLQPNGGPAKTNDPLSWSTFQKAVDAFQNKLNPDITGIGFVFTSTDPYIGIDLDECIVHGEMIPAAQRIVDWCDSYTEISVSGTGLHIIVKGTLPDGIKNKLSMDKAGFKAIEIYDHKRYFTMTGKCLGAKKEIREIDISALPIPQSEDPKHPSAKLPSKNLDPLIEQIKQGNDGMLFIALFEHSDLSQYGGDQSRADLGLVNIISKWTNFDANLTDQLFRQSSLMRAKWDESHTRDGSTYGDITIKKVLDNKRIYNKREYEGYLNYHYRFRYNVVLGRTEIKIEGEWKQLDDYLFNSIRRKMENEGAKITENKLQSLLKSNFVETYHPFEGYFFNLSPWDGKDYIGELADQVTTKDQKYWELCLRKWLVALVASALTEKTVNQTVLILQGGQGVGKTFFLLSLAPKPLNDYLYSGILNPTDKDTMIHLSETLICILDELETLTKYKEGALKEIITKSEIRIRRPYGRFSEKLTRYASLCGTVNDGAILQDPTGSRRFLIHSATSINYKHGLDMDMVYAQALHLYKNGFQYWFDGDEIIKIHSHNQQFENQSVEEELLLAHFRKVDINDEDARKLTSTEILKQIYGYKLPSNTHSAKIKVGQALSKHNFQFKNYGNVKHWIVQFGGHTTISNDDFDPTSNLHQRIKPKDTVISEASNDSCEVSHLTDVGSDVGS